MPGIKGKKFLIKILAPVALFFLCSVAHASYPCVSEVCVGDGLDKLSNIPWIVRAGSLQQINLEIQNSQDYELYSLAKKFQGEVEPAAAYIKFRSFNSLALSKLSKIISSCEHTPLIGRYQTPAGNMTDVAIALLPMLGNPSSQQWRVIRITRHLNTLVTQQQGKEAMRILEERYREYFPTNSKIQKEGDAQVSVSQHYQNEPNSISFTLAYVLSADISDKLRQAPFCGGAKNVVID